MKDLRLFMMFSFMMFGVWHFCSLSYYTEFYGRRNNINNPPSRHHNIIKPMGNITKGYSQFAGLFEYAPDKIMKDLPYTDYANFYNKSWTGVWVHPELPKSSRLSLIWQKTAKRIHNEGGTGSLTFFPTPMFFLVPWLFSLAYIFFKITMFTPFYLRGLYESKLNKYGVQLIKDWI